MQEYEDILRKAIDLNELEDILKKQKPKEFFNPKLFYNLLSQWQKKVEDNLYNNHLNKLVSIFSQAFLRGSRRLLKPNGEKVDINIKPNEDHLQPLFLSQSKYINKLTDDIKKIIDEEIKKGIDKGLTYDEITNNIIKRSNRISRNRIKTIVRSEIVKAHNTGLELTMKEAGFTKYYWITQNDRKVCEICRNYERESLKIGGYDINNPSSPRPVKSSHPNCRCTIVIAEEKER